MVSPTIASSATRRVAVVATIDVPDLADCDTRVHASSATPETARLLPGSGRISLIGRVKRGIASVLRGAARAKLTARSPRSNNRLPAATSTQQQRPGDNEHAGLTKGQLYDLEKKHRLAVDTARVAIAEGSRKQYTPQDFDTIDAHAKVRATLISQANDESRTRAREALRGTLRLLDAKAGKAAIRAKLNSAFTTPLSEMQTLDRRGIITMDANDCQAASTQFVLHALADLPEESMARLVQSIAPADLLRLTRANTTGISYQAHKVILSAIAERDARTHRLTERLDSHAAGLGPKFRTSKVDARIFIHVMAPVNELLSELHEMGETFGQALPEVVSQVKASLCASIETMIHQNRGPDLEKLSLEELHPVFSTLKRIGVDLTRLSGRVSVTRMDDQHSACVRNARTALRSLKANDHGAALGSLVALSVTFKEMVGTREAVSQCANSAEDNMRLRNGIFSSALTELDERSLMQLFASLHSPETGAVLSALRDARFAASEVGLEFESARLSTIDGYFEELEKLVVVELDARTTHERTIAQLKAGQGTPKPMLTRDAQGRALLPSSDDDTPAGTESFSQPLKDAFRNALHVEFDVQGRARCIGRTQST